MVEKLSIYKHIESGDLYFVLLPTNLTAEKADYHNSVSYIGVESLFAYTRIHSEFKEKFVFERRMNTDELINLAQIIEVTE